MNGVVQHLLNLQTLEFSEARNAEIEAQIAKLRTIVPVQILSHYDRLRVRGKKGVAPVRNQSCSSCHMRVPIGQITVLMRDEDIQLCESCGRYLFLPPINEAEPLKAEKPAPKPRKRKAAAAAEPVA